MRSRLTAFIVAPSLLFAGAACANQITNGSFETGNYTSIDPTTGLPVDYVRLAPGSTDITGWIVGGDGLDWHVLTGPGAHFGPSADGGSFAVDLSLDYSPAGAISQTFATTPGAEYRLTFLLGAPLFDAAVDVSVAGVDKSFALPGGAQYGFPWAVETLTFKALSDSTTLAFKSAAGGFWGPAIDGVDVSPVPEPETYAMMMAGLGVLGAIARRRKPAA